jgi:menaquinone-dependent protoporphyrinogen oxidase
MKALVVYGTKTGCTEGIAEHIGERLTTAGATVDVVPADRAGDPAGYDAVVVGSGVRAGQWHEPVRKWVEDNAAALKGRPVAFFTCGLTLASDPTKTAEVRAYTDALIEATGVTPVDIGTFAGCNEPKRFPFVERTVMKMMKAPQGDFRDFTAVDAWADSVAPRLSA